MSRFLVFSIALVASVLTGDRAVFAQDCGCDRSRCATCRSCECSESHVTLHLKTDECGCRHGCRRGCLGRCRPSINIAPASNVAVTPTVQRAAVQTIAYQPVQTVAVAAVQPQMLAVQPVIQRVAVASPQAGLVQQTSAGTGRSCCELLDDRVAELATEVTKISERVNKLIDVVERHDRVLQSLVNKQ